MKKIEVLAPAGSKDSFIAAVNAGANAIYCGLKGFSARANAGNFTPIEFFNFVEYAHQNNVKVYAAFNTLIKQDEMKEAIKQINFISQANADGIIVQDFGIAQIISKHFSNLKLHASTQMCLHNSYGVLQAQKLNFKRAVLSRELSFEEIKSISDKTNIELEIFVHGALCFSVSGLCLMSSFIGGLSGNRGLCAQPCRRKWKFENHDGYYLSPKDFNLSDYINKMKEIGIASLKIEGRMKNPQYVYKTVKAYKLLSTANEKSADYQDILKEATQLLAQDFARPKTIFNFIQKSNDIFTPDISKQTGICLGKVLKVDDEIITLDTNFKINPNDSLKIVDAKNDISFKLKTSTDLQLIKAGMFVYKTGDEELNSLINEIIDKTKIEKKSFDFKEKEIRFPTRRGEPMCSPNNNERLFIKIDDSRWVKHLKNYEKSIVFHLSKEKFAEADKFDCFDIPAFIDETDLPLYQSTIDRIIKNRRGEPMCSPNKKNNPEFFLNNLSHFEFFKGANAKLYAGTFLYALNSFSADFLLNKGIENFTFSVEDDLENITKLSKTNLASKAIFYLSGLHPIAISKMTPHKDFLESAQSVQTIDSSKDSFQIVFDKNKTTVIPKYPIMLFNKKSILEKLQIKKFLIDLSFIPPNIQYFNSLLDAYNKKRILQNNTEFNFNRLLR